MCFNYFRVVNILKYQLHVILSQQSKQAFMKTSFRVKYAENYVFMFWKFTEYVSINIIKDDGK